MSTLLAVDPGITATAGGWLPDLGLLKTWINKQYGPVTKSLAYVTYQPRNCVETIMDDGTDNGRDQFCRFLQKTGYTDVSRIDSTQADNGTVKCNADTSIVRDIWSSLVQYKTFYSPITGHHSEAIKGEYSTFVGVIGDWDIIRPLVTSERVVGYQPTLMDLGIHVVIMYKEACTKKEILALAEQGVITFIPLEKYREELTREHKPAMTLEYTDHALIAC